jgi:hypothetical protein
MTKLSEGLGFGIVDTVSAHYIINSASRIFDTARGAPFLSFELKGAIFQSIEIGDDYVVCGIDKQKEYGKSRGVLTPHLIIYNQSISKPAKKLPSDEIGGCMFDAGDSEHPSTAASLVYRVYLNNESFCQLANDLTNGNLPASISIESSDPVFQYGEDMFGRKKIISINKNERWKSFAVKNIIFETPYFSQAQVNTSIMEILFKRLKPYRVSILFLIIILIFVTSA